MEEHRQQGPSLFPLHRCKIVHLVRHAQGYHNLEGEVNKVAYESEEHFDASLTPTGWQQVEELRKHIAKTGLARNVQLVVVSPMTRTLQTAVGTFGGGEFADGDVLPPLMIKGVGRCPYPAVSSSNCPPFLSVELCREHIGVHPCDRRSSTSIYRTQFPGIDFSEVTVDEDVLWRPNERESEDALYARGRAFVEWLQNRPETEIAVVSHSGFLFHLVSMYGGDCAPAVQKELRSAFDNCGLRTIVIADKSGSSNVSGKTDFPGGIPAGPSAGSDLKDAVDSLAENGVV